MNLTEKLFSLQDKKYREFHLNLVPGYDSERIIGVRTPELRKTAKELIKSGEADALLTALPHRYHEENQLHSFIISDIKDFDRALAETERFLPYIDNWATCDQLRPKIFAKHKDELLEKIKVWIGSAQTYTVRFGIEMLMTYFLDESFRPEQLDMVAQLRSQEYYINMMTAWYFATALAKQYDSAIRIIEDKKLDAWTHNKTIQKARESFRISDEQKEYLKSLKIAK